MLKKILNFLNVYLAKNLKISKVLFVKNSYRGSTIIELLIAVMVVGLIVTAIASSATYSIKNTGESRYRQVATGLGQQVIEHLIGKKNELGIINFSNSLTPGANCYSDIEAPTAGVCGTGQVISMAGADFKRDVTIASGGTGTRANPYFVNMEVIVSWTDGIQTRQVELIQEFKQDSGFTD